MLSRHVFAALVILLVASTWACKPKMPTSYANEIAERICKCETRACAGGLADDLAGIDKNYSGFADSADARLAMKKAAACAQKLEPEIFQIYKKRKMGR
jgi:hypothetical protein